MDNPFALIILSAQKALLSGKIPEMELSEHRLTIARSLIKSQKYSHEQITRFLHFLKNFIYVKDPEINSKFDEEIEILTGKQNTMGIIEAIKQVTWEEGLEKGLKKGRKEGLEKGLEKGKADFVRKLLLNTDFSIDKIAMLADVSEVFIKKVRQELGK